MQRIKRESPIFPLPANIQNYIPPSNREAYFYKCKKVKTFLAIGHEIKRVQHELLYLVYTNPLKSSGLVDSGLLSFLLYLICLM